MIPFNSMSYASELQFSAEQADIYIDFLRMFCKMNSISDAKISYFAAGPVGSHIIHNSWMLSLTVRR